MQNNYTIPDLFFTDLLSGKRILITAGPTREAIDPIRYITNHSSGKMGFALAEAAAEAGAKVTLISGPVQLTTPEKVSRINVVSAKDMYEHVMAQIDKQDMMIGAAAVGDYRCETICDQKIQRTDERMSLTFVRNPDIIAEVAALKHRPFMVGFAAQTNDVINKAREKLIRKRLDMIIANQVGYPDIGFNGDDNEVTLLWGNHGEKALPPGRKTQLARSIIDIIVEHMNKSEVHE